MRISELLATVAPEKLEGCTFEYRAGILCCICPPGYALNWNFLRNHGRCDIFTEVTAWPVHAVTKRYHLTTGGSPEKLKQPSATEAFIIAQRAWYASRTKRANEDAAFSIAYHNQIMEWHRQREEKFRAERYQHVRAIQYSMDERTMAYRRAAAQLKIMSDEEFEMLNRYMALCESHRREMENGNHPGHTCAKCMLAESERKRIAAEGNVVILRQSLLDKDRDMNAGFDSRDREIRDLRGQLQTEKEFNTDLFNKLEVLEQKVLKKMQGKGKEIRPPRPTHEELRQLAGHSQTLAVPVVEREIIKEEPMPEFAPPIELPPVELLPIEDGPGMTPEIDIPIKPRTEYKGQPILKVGDKVNVDDAVAEIVKVHYTRDPIEYDVCILNAKGKRTREVFRCAM